MTDIADLMPIEFEYDSHSGLIYFNGEIDSMKVYGTKSTDTGYISINYIIITINNLEYELYPKEYYDDGFLTDVAAFRESMCAFSGMNAVTEAIRVASTMNNMKLSYIRYSSN